MRMSDSISSLAAALAAAQGQIDDAMKDAENSHFRTKYANLASVRAAIREPLSKNDLAIVQAARTTEAGHVEVETMLLHKSGEYIAETLMMPVTKRDAHGVGSAITYARRYGLMAMLSIASDDDDGNDAANVRTAQQQASSVTPDDLEKLVERGLAAAAKGTDALYAWWKSLSEEGRRAVPTATITKMKSEAAIVDKSMEKNDETAQQ